MPENPYPSGSGMKLNTGKMTMQYEMHRAWDEGFAAGRAAAHPAGHIYEGNCPDEPFSDAAVDKIAWALMGDTLRMIDGLPPGARPAYRQGVRDRVRAALDVALPAAAVSPDQRLREAVRDFLDGRYEGDGRWERLRRALAVADREAPDEGTPDA